MGGARSCSRRLEHRGSCDWRVRQRHCRDGLDTLQYVNRGDADRPTHAEGLPKNSSLPPLPPPPARQYFVAYSDPCAGAEFCPLMADALYGQMVGLYSGFDWHVNKSLVTSHLAAEERYSYDKSGLKVGAASEV